MAMSEGAAYETLARRTPLLNNKKNTGKLFYDSCNNVSLMTSILTEKPPIGILFMLLCK
jgi:hypothetical protein